MATQIQLRRDTAANWTSTNPTMAQGEAGYETDTGKLKIGDGSTAWNSLAYQAAANIVDGTIVDADVNASAAIAGTKISPNFGSQNVVTTGTSTAASLIPTGSSVPTNGVYLPAANSVGISTNGTERLFIASNGRVGISTDNPQTTNGGLDIASGGNGLNIGAEANSTTRTDSTNKTARVSLPHYTNAQPGATILTASTELANNFVNIGGGTSALNAATNVRFFTGATTTTTTGTERMRLDSTGRLGLGTSSPSTLFHIKASSNLTTELPITIQNNADTLRFGIGAYGLSNTVGTSQGTDFYYNVGKDHLFQTDGTTKAVIKEDGKVGIGTTSPDALLTVNGVGAHGLGSVTAPSFAFTGDLNTGFWSPSADAIAASTGGSERARIDSSGRLLVGTSTSASYGTATGLFQVVGTTDAHIALKRTTDNASQGTFTFAKSRGTVGSQTIVNNGDALGSIRFAGYDGVDYNTNAAEILCAVDGTPGTDDMPGRLVFSTTADGASSPTERLRITNAGVLQVADAGNIAVGTTTGTKIGTATTQKLGFYNATPVVQPTAVADATDAATAISQLNALLAHMRTLGLIAT